MKRELIFKTKLKSSMGVFKNMTLMAKVLRIEK
jgi:hypothetical protein